MPLTDPLLGLQLIEQHEKIAGLDIEIARYEGVFSQEREGLAGFLGIILVTQERIHDHGHGMAGGNRRRDQYRRVRQLFSGPVSEGKFVFGVLELAVEGISLASPQNEYEDEQAE
jgi:hypothetical protein